MTNLKSKLIIIYLLMLAMMVFSLTYTNVSQQRTEDKFCAIIQNRLRLYDNYPAVTEVDIQIKKDFLVLEEKLDC